MPVTNDSRASVSWGEEREGGREGGREGTAKKNMEGKRFIKLCIAIYTVCTIWPIKTSLIMVTHIDLAIHKRQSTYIVHMYMVDK